MSRSAHRSASTLLAVAVAGALAVGGTVIAFDSSDAIGRYEAPIRNLEQASRGTHQLQVEPPPPKPAPAPAPPRTSGRVLSPIVRPAENQTVSGVVALEAAPNGPAVAVKWFVDGVEVGYKDGGAPWVKGWDSSTVGNGRHQIHSLTLQPTSSADAGRWFSSAKTSFTVDNVSANTGAREAAPRGNLPNWTQIFVDDFTTDVPLGQFPTKVANQWTAYPSPWRDTSRKGLYSPERVVSIADGALNKYIHSENGQPLIAALTPKINNTASNGSLYGRYSIRFRTDRMEGYKMAWLLWPDQGSNIRGAASGGGGNGEIDFPEMDLDKNYVMGFVHHMNATRGDDQYFTRTQVDFRQWHTYTIEWSPNLVVFLLDGVEVGRTTERVPSAPMHWILQTETTTSGVTPAGVQGNVQIDWVAVWQYVR